MLPPEHSGSDAITANIGPRERRRRATFGIVLVCASLVTAALLINADVARGWRLLLFVPLWAGALGFFLARGRT